MSQKTGKKSRKISDDDAEIDFKMPNKSGNNEDSSKTEKEDIESSSEEITDKTETTNGDDEGSSKRTIQTRSRSNTPLVKIKNTDANESETDEIISTKEEQTEFEKIDVVPEVINAAETNGNETEEFNGFSVVETPPTTSNVNEPVVLEKEEEDASPELQFDENDLEVESEGSPSRCKTRRSQTRNVSTPKTPKLISDHDFEAKTPFVNLERLPGDSVSGRSTPKDIASSTDSKIGSDSQPDVDDIVDLDNSDAYSSVSIDNISTRAVAGSDATRNADFTYQDSGLFDENSIISPSRSLSETLRNLSSRRTIRPINNDYRRLAMHNSVDNKDEIYMNYDSIERVCGSMKRKTRSSSPDGAKRFKGGSAGMSYISNIKNIFSRSSTPKLISYQQKNDDLIPDNPKYELEVYNGGDQEKKWCSIM